MIALVVLLLPGGNGKSIHIGGLLLAGATIYVTLIGLQESRDATIQIISGVDNLHWFTFFHIGTVLTLWLLPNLASPNARDTSRDKKED